MGLLKKYEFEENLTPALSFKRRGRQICSDVLSPSF